MGSIPNSNTNTSSIRPPSENLKHNQNNGLVHNIRIHVPNNSKLLHIWDCQKNTEKNGECSARDSNKKSKIR